MRNCPNFSEGHTALKSGISTPSSFGEYTSGFDYKANITLPIIHIR